MIDVVGATIADTPVSVGDYLERIGLSEPPQLSATWLARAQRAHLETVPFENTEVFRGAHVDVATQYCLDQVVARNRGGWCFVLNGAFAALLEAVGFEVRRLGGAVLLGGPNTVIDHEFLEVVTPEGVFLVDVGFGDRGPIVPLPLNSRRVVDDGIALFTLVDSAHGLTLTRMSSDQEVALYRFRRVTLAQEAFDAASRHLQDDETSPFRRARFASRVIECGGEPAWLTITDGHRKTIRRSRTDRSSLDESEWRRLVDGFQLDWSFGAA